MDCAESQAGSSASDIQPVVVVHGNSKMSGIFGSVIVAVANERDFPVVVEISV